LPPDLMQWLSAKPRNFLDTPISSNSVDTWSMPTTIRASVNDQGGFRIGQQVKHGKFGLGVIVSAEGSGKNTQVEVNFVDHGLKRLALEFAKLVAA
jgi:DNA helicase II / ATP-dependent DNA helicase PcrA